MQRILISCIIFRKAKDFSSSKEYEYLLLRRAPERGGFWQPPGGIKEKSDKSNLGTAYREVFEETCITKTDVIRVIEEVHDFVIDRHHLTNEPIVPIHEFVFAFEARGGVDADICKNVDCEHDEFKWVSFEDAIKMLKWEEGKEAFNRLKTLLAAEKNKIP